MKENLDLELTKKIVDMLVRGAIGVESHNLENKTRKLEKGEKGQVFAIFVHESSEESAVGVDERLGGDIIASNGGANGEIEAVK